MIAPAAGAPLVLSLFPGIGLLDMAFEEEGFCVVRGPDLLWGGDVRRFSPPAGRFDGVIGGPPCQSHSLFAHLVRHTGKETAPDMIPEFIRCVLEAAPAWFLMENVRGAPEPVVPGYAVRSFLLNNRWVGGVQDRTRRFSFGCAGASAPDLSRLLPLELLEPADWCNTVLASGGVKPGTERRRGKRPGREYGYSTAQTVAHALEMQGLPADFFEHSPLTIKGQHHVIGNGVPLPMGRAVARAVRAALGLPAPAAGPALSATPSAGGVPC